MADAKERRPHVFDLAAVPLLLVIMFVAPDYMGDVSLDGLDAYVLSAPVGSTREQVEAGVRRFQHCDYRKPSRSETDGGVNYVYHGTTSDAGFLVSVKVHCPFDQAGQLTGRCTRSQKALIPADGEAFERRTHTDVTQADEWANAGAPECPVQE